MEVLVFWCESLDLSWLNYHGFLIACSVQLGELAYLWNCSGFFQNELYIVTKIIYCNEKFLWVVSWRLPCLDAHIFLVILLTALHMPWYFPKSFPDTEERSNVYLLVVLTLWNSSSHFHLASVNNLYFSEPNKLLSSLEKNLASQSFNFPALLAVSYYLACIVFTDSISIPPLSSCRRHW